MKSLTINKIYSLWMKEIEDYFYENRLRFLFVDVPEDIIQFVISSHKKLEFTHSSITMTFTLNKVYIRYRYRKNIAEQEMDSTYPIPFGEHSQTQIWIQGRLIELNIAKVWEHLIHAYQFEGHMLSLLEWKDISISELGNPVDVNGALGISTRHSGSYLIMKVTEREDFARNILKHEYMDRTANDNTLKFNDFFHKEVRERGFQGIFGSPGDNEILYNDFAIYEISTQ